MKQFLNGIFRFGAEGVRPPFSTSPSESGTVRIGQDVHATSSAGSPDGALVIRFPTALQGGIFTMLRITVEGYDYVTGHFKIDVGAYRFGSGGPDARWEQGSCTVEGEFPGNLVRFGHDGTAMCLIIGRTSGHTWNYPAVTVSRIQTSFLSSEGYLTGWDSYWKVGETGLSQLYTPVRKDAPAEASQVQLYAGVEPPFGWLPCDGRLLSRTAYPLLFSIIGTAYGSGDGSTTFALPDLRGRFPVGAASPPNGVGAGWRYGAYGGGWNTDGGGTVTLDTSLTHKGFNPYLLSPSVVSAYLYLYGVVFAGAISSNAWTFSLDMRSTTGSVDPSVLNMFARGSTDPTSGVQTEALDGPPTSAVSLGGGWVRVSRSLRFATALKPLILGVQRLGSSVPFQVARWSVVPSFDAAWPPENDLTERSLASTGGAESHVLTTAQLPSHSHDGGLQADSQGNILTDKDGGFNVASTGTAGEGQSHPQMPPFAALRYIIRT